jgi:2-polyprenyl-6-methoxyphenol hydroxylase-like FAD-dependent oxidoreductase
MMPFLGQGGAMAFEDAFVLGKLLLKLPSYDLAQEKYNDLRRKRVNYIKSSSALQGYVNHLTSPLLKNVRDYLLKNTNIAMRRTKNIYNYDTLEKLI